jgi:hypothetical protein
MVRNEPTATRERHKGWMVGGQKKEQLSNSVPGPQLTTMVVSSIAVFTTHLQTQPTHLLTIYIHLFT